MGSCKSNGLSFTRRTLKGRETAAKSFVPPGILS